MKCKKSKSFLDIKKDNLKNIIIQRPIFFCDVGQKFKFNDMVFQITKINPRCCLDYKELITDEKAGEIKSMGLSVFRKYYNESKITLI